MQLAVPIALLPAIDCHVPPTNLSISIIELGLYGLAGQVPLPKPLPVAETLAAIVIDVVPPGIVNGPVDTLRTPDVLVDCREIDKVPA